VVFDRKQPVRPSYQNYVLYDRADEFPGRIEVLSAVRIERASNSEPELKCGSDPVEQDVGVEPAAEQWAGTHADLERLLEQDQELDALGEDEREPQPNPDAEPFEVEVERQGTSKRTSLISALFRKRIDNASPERLPEVPGILSFASRIGYTEASS
jgi:hypothetical protein